MNVGSGLANHVRSGVRSVQKAITDIKSVGYAMTAMYFYVDAVGSGVVSIVMLLDSGKFRPGRPPAGQKYGFQVWVPGPPVEPTLSNISLVFVLLSLCFFVVSAVSHKS